MEKKLTVEPFLRLSQTEQDDYLDTLGDFDAFEFMQWVDNARPGEMEQDAEMLAGGVQPHEINPRREALEELCSAVGHLCEQGATDDLYWAMYEGLYGRGSGEMVEHRLALWRASVKKFEQALGRTQRFMAEDYKEAC